MKTLNETAETECPKCSKSLHYFLTTNNDTEKYCINHNCNYSTNYNRKYTSAWEYYREHKENENIEEFNFVGESGRDKQQTIEESTRKEYKLDLDDVIGLSSLKRQL